jgi:predicted nucleotidyltransferase
MADLNTYFNDFLSSIRLTKNQVADCKKGHEVLRKRLCEDENLKDIIVSVFLQGSYKRSTAVRPLGESRSDVDVIVVTRLDKDSITPERALEKFRGFLRKWYEGKYERQGRSWGIELSYVSLDLVPTTAPGEVAAELAQTLSVTKDITIEESTEWPFQEERSHFFYGDSSHYMFSESKAEWKSEPLWIPDRDADEWDQTDPLTQIFVTQEKNKSCNRHFVNVVKCLKWWRKAMQPDPKYPKSYPLEHLIFLNCPDGIETVAQGVVETLEAIRNRYRYEAITRETPFVPDHGVPVHNVLARVSGDDFADFHQLISDAAELARKAYDEPDTRESAELWQKLFGNKFPDPPKNDKNYNVGGYSPRQEESVPSGGRFA